MTMKSDAPKLLTLGYDLDAWNGYGAKVPITTDISPVTNSHILICGMSGSGKSYYENALFSKLVIGEPHGEFHFADYKGMIASHICVAAPVTMPIKIHCKR